MAKTTSQSSKARKSNIVYSPSVWRAMEKYAKTRQEQQQLKRIDSIVIACLLLEVVVFLIISAIFN